MDLRESIYFFDVIFHLKSGWKDFLVEDTCIFYNN